jgi:hypothetical protein
MKPIIFDDFLTEDEMKFTEEYFKKHIWKFGHASFDSETASRKWFHTDLDDLPFFTEYLKEKIERIDGSKYDIYRVYANGQTVLNGGSWHQDSYQPDWTTALLYISDINIDNVEHIQGHTEFKINNEIVSIEPFKNRLVLFDSRVIHRGNAPNIPGFFRISVAWKLIKI